MYSSSNPNSQYQKYLEYNSKLAAAAAAYAEQHPATGVPVSSAAAAVAVAVAVDAPPSYNPQAFYSNENSNDDDDPEKVLQQEREQQYNIQQKIQTKTRVPWSTGLFDCFSDFRNCCITCWCPCITFGQIAEIVDKGSTSCGASGALYALVACVTAFPCCYSCFYRAKLRQQYLLQERPCGDCLVHCCCESCALCQEYRELKNRGYDMSIGWHGNMERQNRELEMESVPPTVEGGMSR